MDLLAEAYAELDQPWFRPSPPLDIDVLARQVAALPHPADAIEAPRDGDNDGWFVCLVAQQRPASLVDLTQIAHFVMPIASAIATACFSLVLSNAIKASLCLPMVRPLCIEARLGPFRTTLSSPFRSSAGAIPSPVPADPPARASRASASAR
jgi:hypothetical protein